MGSESIRYLVRGFLFYLFRNLNLSDPTCGSFGQGFSGFKTGARPLYLIYDSIRATRTQFKEENNRLYDNYNSIF